MSERALEQQISQYNQKKENDVRQIATVVNNNQPEWHNIVKTEPNVTLPIDTKLYLAEPIVAIGSPLSGGFFAGEFLLEGEHYALVVAPKAAGEKMGLEYKAKNRNIADGTDSDEDGVANSERINDDNHPAAQFCQSLKIGDHEDWYLPSRDELAMLWRNLGPRRKNTPDLFREGGAEAFESDWYWSSTENASYSYDAWDLVFNDGFQSDYNKSNNFGVRAVRRLKI